MKVDLYYYEQHVHFQYIQQIFPDTDHELKPTYIGYIEVEKFDLEEIFHLCNWSHWLPEKPVNLYSKIKSCGHGLMMINPENNQRYLAKSMGWLIGNEDTINKYVEENRYRLYWR